MVKRIRLTLLLMILVGCQHNPPRENQPMESSDPLWLQHVQNLTSKNKLSDIFSNDLNPSKIIRIWIINTGEEEKTLTHFFARNETKSEGYLAYFYREKLKKKGAIFPKSSWKEFWNKVDQDGIENLPDQEELPQADSYFHGSIVCVEVISEGKYKSYHYNNPWYGKLPEQKTLSQFILFLASEFE